MALKFKKEVNKFKFLGCFVIDKNNEKKGFIFCDENIIIKPNDYKEIEKKLKESVVEIVWEMKVLKNFSKKLFPKKKSLEKIQAY